jgi:hypothetical protein
MSKHAGNVGAILLGSPPTSPLAERTSCVGRPLHDPRGAEDAGVRRTPGDASPPHRRPRPFLTALLRALAAWGA